MKKQRFRKSEGFPQKSWCMAKAGPEAIYGRLGDTHALILRSELLFVTSRASSMFALAPSQFVYKEESMPAGNTILVGMYTEKII